MGVTVSLGEGNTPLLRAPRLSERLGCEVWLKWEGVNPTGSMKDRGMALAVARAVERGAPGIVVASTGNTAASAAAYAARVGLPAIVLLPEGAVARGKIAQAIVAGAEIRPSGTFEDAHREARRLAEEEGLVNVNSINPDRIEGQSSAAVEIVDQLGGTLPDVVALPYGGGGNTRAFAMGFDRAGAGMPRILSVQAARRADTAASAIRIIEPVHREQAEALAEVVTVTDDELYEWWRATARLEGVFCELASAAGVAGVAQVHPEGRVVCVLTGHGLKDPDAVERL
jgi:threonine synthase